MSLKELQPLEPLIPRRESETGLWEPGLGAAGDPALASPAGAGVQCQCAVHEEDGGAHPPEQKDPLRGQGACPQGVAWAHEGEFGPPPPGGCRPVHHCLPPPVPGLCSPPCFSGPDLSSLLPPFSQIFPLISQARWLVRHGELVELAPLPAAPPAKLKLSSKTVYLHLFNDCLLLSRRKE